MFKLAIYQVVTLCQKKRQLILCVCWAGPGIFPEFGSVNLDPTGSILVFSILQLLRFSGLATLHIHSNDIVGQVNQEAVFKRWDLSGNRKIHLALMEVLPFEMVR